MSAQATVEHWWRSLRAQGVPVDPEQLDAAVRVSIALERAAKLDRLLATVQGVLTKNERDAAILQAIAAETKAEKDEDAQYVRRKRRLRWFAWIGLAVAVSAVMLIGHRINEVVEEPPLVKTVPAARLVPPPPLVETGGLRLRNNQSSLSLEVVTPVDPLPPLLRALMISVPALLILVVFLLWRSRAPRWMDLSPDQVEDRLYNQLPEGRGETLFRSSALQTLSQSLTARTNEVSTGIDVVRTVEATARNAGLLKVILERPVVESPIHLAIERKSRDDHVAELFFRLADRLRALGIYVQVTQFRHDLRSRVDEADRRVGSPRPEPGEDRALLVVVGDGENILGVSGAPNSAQLASVLSWPQRALLSTRPVLLWGDREEALVAARLAIAPASSSGLNALVQRLWRDENLSGAIGVRAIPRRQDLDDAA